MKKIVLIFMFLFLLPLKSFGGEIDGKGLICDKIGFFFRNNFVIEFSISNAKIIETSLGNYETTPKIIYFGDGMKLKSIDRKTLLLTRGLYQPDMGKDKCVFAKDYGTFLTMYTVEKMNEGNKI